MLKPHRRHVKACRHASKGWNYTLCNCPIWADGMLHGKRFTRSLGTNDWDRAVRRIGKLERGEEVESINLDSAGRTIASAITAYIAEAELRNLKPSTVISYRRTLNQLVDFTGKIPVANLTLERLTAFRARRSMMPRTQRKEIEYLRAFCGFCVTRGWIATNPAKLVKPPRVEEIATRPYTREEIDKLLIACDRIRGMWKSDTPQVRQRARALVLTLLYTGLRCGDVAQLKRSALEPSGHLVLRIMKTEVPLKVLLHPDAAKALRGLPASGGNPVYFFWSGNGDIDDCSKSLWRTVSRVGKVAKIHAHPHRFRDTFAVELLTNGVDIRTVQQLLGHESIRTTEKHYAHFVAAHQKLLDTAAATLDFRPRTSGPILVRSLKNRKRNR
jgi:site-specific recombinase XerD